MTTKKCASLHVCAGLSENTADLELHIVFIPNMKDLFTSFLALVDEPQRLLQQTVSGVCE